MPEDRFSLGQSPPVPDLLPCRVLRQLVKLACVQLDSFRPPQQVIKHLRGVAVVAAPEFRELLLPPSRQMSPRRGDRAANRPRRDLSDDVASIAWPDV
jgi:hypothetical protein